MTAPDRNDGGAATQDGRPALRVSSQFRAEGGGDAYIRRAGRGFIISLHAALRAIRLYPLENTAVQNAVDDLTKVAGELIAREHELEIRV
jgi:hypothetical protein